MNDWVDDNGKLREATSQEKAEWENWEQKARSCPTTDERVADLTEQVNDLTLLMADLVGGAVR